jgi:ankyrin repeat protein
MKLTPENVNSWNQKELDDIFIILCEKGKLKEIKYLFTNEDLLLRPKINENRYNPLRVAAQEGHINVLHYLLTSTDLKENADIHLHNDYALISACEKNHLETVKYLLSSPKLREHANIHAQRDGALKTAILYNNFEIAHYLLTDEKLKEKANANEALLEVCYTDDLAGLEFLTSKEISSLIDIHLNKDQPFEILIENEHINLIKYLINDYQIDITDKIKKIAKNKNEEIFKLIEAKQLHNTLSAELKNDDQQLNSKKVKL